MIESRFNFHYLTFICVIVLLTITNANLWSQPVPVYFNGDTIWVHPTDIAGTTATTWGGWGTQTYATSLTNGQSNTNTIVSVLGSGNYAAYLCYSLTAFGSSDWYLPAINELGAIFQIGGFSNSYYWSSTEYNAPAAPYQAGQWSPLYSGPYYPPKFNGGSVRCVCSNYSYNTLSISISDTTHCSCYGYSDGLATVTPNSGNPPYTYNWSSSSTDSTAINLSAGWYFVTVTDHYSFTAKDSIEITEPTPFIVSISAITSDYCDNAPPINLSATPSGGIFNGPGIVSSTFNPSQANIGSNQIVYSYTDANSCTNRDTINLIVKSSPNVNIATTLNSNYCQNEGTIILSVSPNGGNFFGSISTSLFDPKIAQIGQQNIYYSFIDTNGCSGIDSVSTIVSSNPTVSITTTLNPIYCTKANSVNISATPSGGTYSGQGVVGSSFNPSLANIGTNQIIYTYTDSNSCTGSDTVNTSVISNPVVNILTSLNSAYCQNDAAITILTTPVGGLFSGSIATAYFDPSIVQTGQQNIIYTYTDTNGCSGSDTVYTFVNSNPVVTISAFADICENTASFALSGGTPVNGTYSGFGVSNGNFDALNAGIGNHIITYTYSNTNGCIDSAQQFIQVHPLPFVSLLPYTNVCENAPAFVLIGESPVGGTFSGNGVLAGIFSPATAGVGTHSITYKYSDMNGCLDSALASIQVLAVPIVSLSAFSDVCDKSQSFTLTGGSPVGGTYSVNGITAGVFNPSNAGPGTHTITYKYSNINSCTDSAQQTITVNPLPNISLTSFSDICESMPSFTLSGGSPTGGTYFGNGVNAGVFNPSIAGVGSHSITYTYTNLNGCTDSLSKIQTVHAIPNVIFDTLFTICNNDTNKLLIGFPQGGTFSGLGVNNGRFYPSVAGAGSHAIKYTYTNLNGCTDSVSRIQIVHAAPIVSFSTLSDVCVDAPIDTLSGVSPLGGTFIGTGVNGVLFNPLLAGVGYHPITYSYTDSNNCTDTAIQHINVFGLPIVNIGSDTMFCAGNNVVVTPGTNYTSYLWSDSTTSTSLNISSTDTIWLSAIDSNGCLGKSDTIIVTEHPIPNVTITKIGSNSFCDGDSLIINLANGYLYEWHKNNSPIDTTTIPLYSIFNSGNYYAIVKDTFSGCYDTTALIQVVAHNSNFGTNFSCFPTQLSSPPFAVLFNNTTSIATNIEFTWYFGDGNYFNGFVPQNNTHTYLYNGIYDVFNYTDLGSIVGDRLRSNGNPTEFGFFGTGTGTIRLTTPKSPEIDYRPFYDFK